MSFNQVENAFLGRAIKNLKAPYRSAYPDYRGPWGLAIPGITFMVIESGEDTDKLTVAKAMESNPSRYEPDPAIAPVDCYNLMLPGEDMATAVQRVFVEGRR